MITKIQRAPRKTVRSRERGFSLIELLIVIAIILIIAAIAIPSLLHSKIVANEASAVASLRTIVTAETTYASSWGTGYAAGLTNLGGGTGCVSSAATACIIDPLISTAPFAKSGYTFAAAANTLAGGVNNGFELNATPGILSVTGQRAFCADQTGTLRYTTTGVAIGTGAGSCNAVVAFFVGN
jgi:prepilin-type N-terminal cleavage/methylation domain-containing protein